MTREVLSPSINEDSNNSKNSNKENDVTSKQRRHLSVLPVILLEFLALAVTRAVLPSMLLQKFGKSVYMVMGMVECIRGVLAFLSCPFFGKLSDAVGRRGCLFVTVLGTCAPVCSLAFLPLNSPLSYSPGNATLPLQLNNETATEMNIGGEEWTAIQNSSALVSYPVDRIWLFVLLLALSGVFSSTFTLTFAYISDTLVDRSDRVSAYGLALATFGFSFTIGPMAGGYIATHSQDPAHRPVFVAALILTTLDLLYIYFFLPETVKPRTNNSTNSFSVIFNNISYPSFTIFYKNPLLQKVAQIAFLYYTSLWAIISTLIIYAVNRFHLAPDAIGHLISALGFSTMLAEAFLVRILVPFLGEKRAMQLGLLAFSLQCFTLAFAFQTWHLFLSVAFSALSNLVYPSLTSLLTSAVPPQSVGEVLGAVNGIKALTEGLGPFIFGMLMTFTEDTILPGSPYLVAACLSYFAYTLTHALPNDHDEDYTLDKCSSLANPSSSCRPFTFSLFTSFTPAHFQQSVQHPCSTASSIMNHEKEIEMNSEFCSLLSNQDDDDDNDDNYRYPNSTR